MGACLGAEPLACEPELLAPVGGDEIAGFGTWRRAESLDLEAGMGEAAGADAVPLAWDPEARFSAPVSGGRVDARFSAPVGGG